MNLTHHFLIAMPAMADPHFSRTLTFICEHNDQGALGIVINRPTEMNLATLLEQVSIPLAGEAFKAIPIHFGGPVQVDRGFVLHTPLGQWQSTLAVSSAAQAYATGSTLSVGQPRRTPFSGLGPRRAGASSAKAPSRKTHAVGASQRRRQAAPNESGASRVSAIEIGTGRTHRLRQ